MSGFLKLVLTSLMVIQLLATPLLAAERAPQPAIGNDQGVRQKFATGAAHFCERILVGFKKLPKPLQGPVRMAGYVTGVIPLAKVLSNSDKSFFVLIESPLIGLATTPASIEVANILAGHGGDFDAKFITNAKELYVSYQGANIIRNGVSIDETLSPEARSWLNWWYSTVFYAWQTAGAKLMNAHTHSQTVHAWSQVLYSGLWPVFSQRVSQYVITPLLFSKYPKESLLKKIHDTSNSLESMVTSQEAAILSAEQNFAAVGPKTSENKVAYAKAKSDLDTARHSLKWIKWFRAGVADGQMIPKTRDAKYWGLKTRDSMGAAVAMVTVYLLARRLLVGDEGEDKILQLTVEQIMKGLGYAKAQWIEFQPEIEKQIHSALEEMGEQEAFIPVF